MYDNFIYVYFKHTLRKQKQRCENLNEKVISLAQLKVLMPLLSKLEKFGKINGKELYEIVQVEHFKNNLMIISNKPELLH